jgi:hypothetical protein
VVVGVGDVVIRVEDEVTRGEEFDVIPISRNDRISKE